MIRLNNKLISGVVMVLASCNNPTDKREFSGSYFLDLHEDSCIYKKLNVKDLRMVLNSDGSYYFEPEVSELVGYEGKWDVTMAGSELGNFLFECQNGEKQENSIPYLRVKINGQHCSVYFTKGYSQVY